MLLTLTGYAHGAAQVFLATGLAATAQGVSETEFGGMFGESLREVVTADRFPAIASALTDGSFEIPDDDMQDFKFGLDRVLDGIAAYAGLTSS